MIIITKEQNKRAANDRDGERGKVMKYSIGTYAGCLLAGFIIGLMIVM